MLTVLAALPPLLVIRLADPSPQPEDVKAGWTAFTIFLLLLVAVVLLGFSLAKQLRKVQAAKDSGVYGDASDPADGTRPRPEPDTQPDTQPGTQPGTQHHAEDGPAERP